MPESVTIPFRVHQRHSKLVVDLTGSNDVSGPGTPRPPVFGDQNEKLPVVVATDDFDEETTSGKLLQRVQRRQLIRLGGGAPR